LQMYRKTMNNRIKTKMVAIELEGLMI
jgi:hypothetical protein